MHCNALQEERESERERKRDVASLLLSWYCKYSVTLPHGAVGWSALCNCGIK